MADTQGKPIWYELSTATGQMPQAAQFYTKVLGWEVAEAGMEGVDYHLARMGGDMVAGMMELPEGGEVPPNWMIYFAVDDCDAAVKAIGAADGKLLFGPQDVPDTGRFAAVADPQGAVFGVLAPEPMDDGSGSTAFAPGTPGHARWNELMSSDPEAALAFYRDLFGWQKSDAIPMGDMGVYQTLTHDGTPMGAIMGLGNSPMPVWLAYFGVLSCAAAMERIKAGGGTIQAGPIEVPGAQFVAVATDPQGAWFAVMGGA